MGPRLSTDEELAQYPKDGQDLIRSIEHTHLARHQYCVEEYSHTVVENGHKVHYDKKGRAMYDSAISQYFGLSRASWLTIPRLSLEDMDPKWQAQFVALLHEAEDKGLAVPSGTEVRRRIKGKMVPMGKWNNYRRETVASALAEDEARGYPIY